MADTLESLEIEVKHSATGAAEEISKVASAIQNVSRALTKALPNLKMFSEIMDGSFNVTDNSTTQIADNISNVTNVASNAKKATTDASRGIREMGKEAKKAQTPLDNFVASLKRIAFYRFIRSIIKNITQAFTEGLQWAYQFSAGIEGEGHRFASAMDSMKSASVQMKAQIGSAFISLLAMIAPIVNQIISLVTSLANALSQLFAAFTGGTYLKATQTSQKFADTMKSGGSAAKEWKNQLMGFDVINRLNEPNKGGGGGGSALDPNELFEETKIDGIFMRIKQKFDELKESLNFDPIINSWNKFKESVSAFADIVVGALAWGWENVLVPLAHWTIEKAAPAVLDLLASAINFLCEVLSALQPVFQWAWDNIFVPLAEWTGEIIIGALRTLTDLLDDLTSLLRGNKTFKEFIDQLSPWEEILLAIATAVAAVYAALGVYNAVMAISTLVTGGFSAALAFLAANPIVLVIAGLALLAVGIIELIKHWDKITAAVENFKTKLHDALNDGKVTWLDFVAVFAQAIAAPINAIKSLIGWISSLVGWLKTAISGLGIFNGLRGGSGITVGSPAGFASGGFPDEGQLFIANESGAELVGQMGNRTAVANNEQIVQGIERGVYNAMSAAMSNNSGGGVTKVYLDGKEIANAVTRQQRGLERATGVAY